MPHVPAQRREERCDDAPVRGLRGAVVLAALAVALSCAIGLSRTIPVATSLGAGTVSGDMEADGGAIEQRHLDAGTWPALRIDLNSSETAALKLLPGIGPALAERIVEERVRHGVFRSVDDLARVRGIGPRTVERLRPHVTVESPSA